MRSYYTYIPVRLKRQSIVAVLWVMLSLIGFFDASAQNVYGWEKEFGGDGPDEAKGIVEMRDRGMVLVGATNSFGNANQIYTIRTDIDGTVLWVDTVGTAGNEMGLDITVASDQNGVVVVGNGESLGSVGGGRGVIFYKLDDDGNNIWTKYYSTDNDDEAFGITTAIDGGYIITGYTENLLGDKDLFLLKVDSDGNEEWVNTYGGDFDQIGNAVAQMPNGNFVATGRTEDASGNINIYVVKVNNNGFLLFEENYGIGSEYDEGQDVAVAADGTVFITGQTGNQSDVAFLRIEGDNSFGGFLGLGASNLFKQGNGITLSDDGNIVIAGFTESSAIDIDFFLLKVNPNGLVIWEKNLGQDNRIELGFDLVKTYDSGFAIVGSRALTAFSNPDVYLIKTNKNGETLTNHIIGKAYRDSNNDCAFQNSEGGVRNWIVEAKGAARTFYGAVDVDGNFDVLTDTGSYEVNIIIPNVYWNSMTCQAMNFQVDLEKYDTVLVDYPIQTEIDCPVMNVDVSTSRIIPCEDNIYRIDFCNEGTQIAVGAEVDLILEKNLDYVSSSLPFVFNDDSLFTFAIGNIDVGTCGFFEVRVNANCGITIEEEAHCINVSIRPDATCLAPDPTWDGSSIFVDSYCDGDSVIFLLENRGTNPMTQKSEFIVVEDIVLMFQGQPQESQLIPAGGVQRLALPATGKHYRIVVDQSPNHPGRNYFATASVEACDPNNVGPSLGFATQLEESDRDPYQSKDVQENQLSFDPIDFKGYPKGYRDTCATDADLITSQTDLKYHIRFQNVSMDSSHRVVIRDTIPSNLDITTIRPGSSSHPYTFEAYGDGFVKFTFSELGQVNNTTNELLSHGFVKYRISQKPNNPVGTIIENSAIVFQDYNAPIDTDVARHQVGGDNLTDFLCFTTSTVNPNFPNVSMEIYPNPFTEFATIKIEGEEFKDLNFQVFDATGKQVRTQNFKNNQLEFYRNQLPQGLYVFTINVKGQVVSSGKLIIQ